MKFSYVLIFLIYLGLNKRVVICDPNDEIKSLNNKVEALINVLHLVLKKAHSLEIKISKMDEQIINTVIYNANITDFQINQVAKDIGGDIFKSVNSLNNEKRKYL